MDHLQRELLRLQRVAVTSPREAIFALDEVTSLRARLIAARNEVARQAAALDRSIGATRAYGAKTHQKRIGR